MNFFKVAGRDISSIFKNRFIRVSVIAIIVVPLLYSLLYLYAFWDPYNRLQDLPVAVVNMDKGATKDGEPVNYGKDLVDKLKDNNKIGWRFVSKEEAEKGLKDKKGYYAMFVVPEDFSTKVISAKDGKPQEPSILYSSNDKKSFLASQINGKVLVELKSELTKNIVDEYTKVTFDNLYDVKDGMQKASDGSKELYDGVGTLNDKVPELKDGVNKLADGSGDLNSGLGQAKNGAAQLYYGANAIDIALGQAKDGAGQIHDGLGQLNSQVPALKDGVSQLYKGSGDLKDGATQINDGINTLGSKLGEAKDGAKALDDGAGKLQTGLGQVGAGLSQLNDAVSKDTQTSVSLSTGVKSLYDGITNQDPTKGLGAAIKVLNAKVNTGTDAQHPSLVAGITGINDGIANRLSPGLNALNTSVSSKLSPNVKALAASTKSLDDAVKLYNDTNQPQQVRDAALTAILQGIPQLNAGMSQLNTSVNTTTDPAKPSLVDSVAYINAAVNTTTDAQHPSLVAAVGALNTGITDPDPTKGLGAAIGALNTKVNLGTDALHPSLVYGITAVNSGVNVGTAEKPSLVNAVAQLNGAVNTGIQGQPSVLAGIKQIKDGTSQLAPGMVAAVDGTKQLSAGSQKLYDGTTQLNNGLYTLNGNVPALADGVGKLYAGSTDLNSGISQIKDGSTQLKSAIAKPEEVKDIPQKETSSTDTLFAGMTKLYDGSNQLKDGLGTLKGNIPELQDGVGKLYDGSKELSDKLKEGSDKINKNLVNDSKTMAEFVSEPLKMDEEPAYAIKNYGTGFTPYFIPLSLWVGALMMFFVISDDVDSDVQAGSASIVLGKFLTYGVIGTIQALLASSIVIVLGLQPANVPLYFLFNILLSLVFVAIIQCLIFLMGQVGRLLSIVLLILQLTACAGTFPLEVVPTFFKILNPFMPFTYAVSGLREVIAGMDYSVFMKDVTVLATTMAVFLFISVLMKGHADRVKERIKQAKESATVV
ncbi:YhgE/Pip domain-containing protein [Clostridium sp. YIM B02515]|uniref:YhgE/Pip domain-containing protein n=1 Tax=Clostridium rhizosphaerae TaxID=2803861 RepID=A0ABS1TGX4_9CLOT|nr:YhgE/Pip domain-containing protein [Clostridium rhizosphaerae]MBL4937579.1 YhgE/Pip domain-containing protein [Clostridium rhizosphaerae]